MFASKATGKSPLGFYTNSVLPVNFVSFNASKLNDAVVAISWSTSDEINNSHFEIQRSVDGINWSSIATVFPAEDAASVHLYKYNDKFPVKGNTYYRIRQVDIDGRDKYTSVRVIGGVKSELETLIYVSAKSTVTVELIKATNSNVTVRLVNMNGVIVNQKANNHAGEKISLLAYNAAPGAYVVQVIAANGTQSTKKIIL
jgi:hypothetical protein